MGRNTVIILLLLSPLWLTSAVYVYPQAELLVPVEQNKPLLMDHPALTFEPSLGTAIAPRAPGDVSGEDGSMGWHPLPYLLNGNSPLIPLLPGCSACAQEEAAPPPLPSIFSEQTADPAAGSLPAAAGRKITEKEIGKIFALSPWTTYLYFLRPAPGMTPRKPRQKKADRIRLNAVYVRTYVDEKEETRKIWAKTLGVDVWYPYFKAKEVEDWFKERCSFRIRKMKCKPQFRKNNFVYVCKKTF